MKNFIIITILISSGLYAQSNKNLENLLVFQPDETSAEFNEIYTHNFFFGNFGIRPLVNSLPINSKGIKTIRISGETDGQKFTDVVVMNYDKNGNLIQMKINKMLNGKDMTVDYEYKDGFISKESFKEGKETSSNTFHYVDGKMIVENIKDMTDVYSLKDKTLYKESYMDGKLVFKDRIEGKCRITSYQNNDIDKICFNNFNSQYPLTMEEFTPSENVQTGKTTLEPESKWEIKKPNDKEYQFIKDGNERYNLKLDKKNRVQTFNYLGNKSEKKKPVQFNFSYTEF